MKFLFFFSTQMFQQPSFMTMVIAATRMHRSLIDFTSKEVYDTRPPMQDDKGINAASRPTNPIEVDVHVVSEQHWMSRTTDDESGISMDERQAHDKSSRDDDLERGIHK
jgi:hypothetical protein